MRILHTSDLHLKIGIEKFTRAVESILDIARRMKVDVLTIGGDIFDSPVDADEMRGKLRNLFYNIPIRVIAIPGNHDGNIFSKGFDFGFEVTTEHPYAEIEFDDAIIVAMPYTDMQAHEILPGLKQAANSAKPYILLLHCTLDIGFDDLNYGDDNSQRYFPVSRASLAGLGYDFILAGHFHKDCQVLKLSDKCTFIYPGSPVSNTRRELGKRHAILIDTDKKKVTKVPLPTFYYDSLIVDIRPGFEKDKIEDVRSWYEDRKNDDCELEITVRGLMKQDEGRFRKALEKAAPESTLRYEVKDVREVLDYPLYQRFKKTLPDLVQDPERSDVDDMVLEVMSSLIAGGDLE